MKQILKDILKTLSRRETQKLWQLTVADIFISILDIVFLISLLYVVNFYTQSGVPHASAAHMRVTFFNEHPIFLIVIFLFLFTIKNIIGFLVSRAQYNYVYGVASRISGDSLSAYLNGPYSDYIQVDSSVINRKISQQPVEFCHYVLNGVQQIFSQIVLILITLIAVVIFNPLLLPLLLLILVPPIFLITFFVRKKLHEGRMQGKRISEKSIQHLQEALTGYVESNMYFKNDFFTNRYQRFQSQLNHYLSDRLTIQNMPTRFIEVFAVFGLFLLILFNFLHSGQPAVPFITLGALMVAAYKIIPGIVKITNLAGQAKTYAYSAKGLKYTEATSADEHDTSDFISSVCFDNIYFAFSDRSILRSFCLKIAKGEMIGISGMSGRGKTTLVNLLVGFLSPDSGLIYINGVNADAQARKQWRTRISYVKQQHFFLYGTIAENITFEEMHYDRKRLNDILALTGIDQMLPLLPHGLDTVITENGKNLSGGQRQRFMLARALYKDFDLLILDEPFNELDKAAEIQLLKHLRMMADTGKMILLITHNSDALAFCHQTIQLDNVEK